MISAKHRFHGRASLRFVYQKGSNVRGPHFSTRYILNNRRSTYRAAVVVSRKVNKSAVARNRIRRRLYEAIRSVEADISGPYDIVINVFNDSLAELPAENLQSQIRHQLLTAGVLKS